MDAITDALRQRFMAEYQSLPLPLPFPLHEYNNLRPLILTLVVIISVSVLISSLISIKIVFPGESLRRPFCSDVKIHALSLNFTNNQDLLNANGNGSAFLLTDQETVDYYWMVIFLPSAILFVASLLYLLAGIVVAYHAPTRHGCLKVVENDYCASRRGGVRCLSIINLLVAIAFGVFALFLGSTLLTLGSSCSVPLFWCYEISSWGLVLLYGGTAFSLRVKAAVVLDESDFAAKNLGVEMLEANPVEFSPDVDRRVTEGFKAWMGPSFLSSDEEDEHEDYNGVPTLSRTNSSRQGPTTEV